MNIVTTLRDLTEVISNSSKCVIKIGTPICGACAIVENNMKVVEKESAGVSFVVIDGEGCEDAILDTLAVDSIPTLIVYKDGVESKRKVGISTVDDIRNFLA